MTAQSHLAEDDCVKTADTIDRGEFFLSVSLFEYNISIWGRLIPTIHVRWILCCHSTNNTVYSKFLSKIKLA